MNLQTRRKLQRTGVDPQFEADSGGTLWKLVPHHMIDDSIASFATLLHPLDPINGEPGFTRARLRLPPDEGSGVWDVLKLTPNLYAMFGNFEYHRDRTIQVPGDRMVKIRILLAGALHVAGDEIVLDGTGAYLEAFPGQVSSSYVIKGGVRTKLLVLICAPEFFSAELGLETSDIPQPISHLFSSEAGAPRGGTMPLGPDLLRAANDIMHAPSHFPASLLVPYVNAKARECACSVLRELTNTSEATRAKMRLSVRDVSRLYEARDVLLAEFTSPPVISKLARQVGLNQTKLKAGFKSVFDMTITEFVQKCRMEKAGDLLTSTDLTIAEVAYAVGYDFPANFTCAFKRYYGHVPRQLRRAVGAV